MENIETRNINSKYLDSISYDDFEDNDNIIIESGTGTGKTYIFSHHVSKYLSQHNDKKILSIFGKRNLGKQQQKYFMEKNIKIEYYTDSDFKKNIDGNLLICINSLNKYSEDLIKNKNNYVLFIDEVTLFTMEITHNSTITELKNCYYILKLLIKNCAKLYVCQNEISHNVFNLIEKRINTKSLFIKNKYKTNNGKKAIRFNSLDNLIEKMKDDISKNKYFLYASDSKKNIDIVFEMLIKDSEEKEKYFKFTADSETFSADFNFKEKYVFYSPCISTGVDCTLPEEQNQYLYIKGKSVDSMTLYQMCNRTRNMKNLYYVCDKFKEKKPRFITIEDCNDFIIKNTKNVCKSLRDMCEIFGENDEISLIENSFFKLFAYNEFVLEKYNCDLIDEFEKLLIINGFEIIEDNSLTKNKNNFKLALEDYTDICNEQFEDYVEGKLKNEKIDLLCEKLQIGKKEDKLLHRKYLQNKYNITGHFQFFNFFATKDYLKNKIFNKSEKNFMIKTATSELTKIIFLRKLANICNIDLININNGANDIINISDDDFEACKSLFDSRLKKFNLKIDVIKFLVKKINNICNCDIYKSNIGKVVRIGNKTKKGNSTYNINQEEINNQFELYKFRSNYFNLEQFILDHQGIEYLSILDPDNEPLDWDDLL